MEISLKSMMGRRWVKEFASSTLLKSYSYFILLNEIRVYVVNVNEGFTTEYIVGNITCN